MTTDPYTIYLAGPMSNIPEFNFPKFFDAAAYLRQIHGWEVLSPAEKDLESIPWEEMQLVPGYDTGDLATYVANSSFTMANAMEWDLPAIQKSDGIVLLDGWETSTGARWERAVAEALDRDIWLLHTVPGRTGLHEWVLERDGEPKQLTTFMKGFGAPQAFRVEVALAPTEHESLERARAYVDDQLEQLHKLPWPVPAEFPEGPSCPLPRPTDGEVRVIDPSTGGAKGSKLARYDLVPQDALWAIAEHFGRGARKYEDRNWEKGYAWSLSYAALQRHIAQWWQGEDIDPDPALLDEDRVPRSLHLTAVAWHAMVLLAFALRDGDGTDDRPTTPQLRWEAEDLR